MKIGLKIGSTTSLIAVDYAIFHRGNAERSRAPLGLGISTTRTGANWWRCCVALMQFRDHLLFVPCVDNPFDRHAIHTRRPLIGLDLPPGLPEDVRSPDLVIETIKPSLLVLLGCAV